MNPETESLTLRERFINGKTALAAGVLVVASACTGGGETVNDLETGDSDISQQCDVPAWGLGEYQEKVGTGPFTENDAYDAEKRDNDEVIQEAAIELPGNVLGLALLSESKKLQEGKYTVANFLNSANETFSNLTANEEARQDTCEAIVETILAEGELVELKATQLIRVTNSYNEDGSLAGLKGELVESQGDIPAITVRDENGAARWGLVTEESRDGEYVLVITEGTQAGDEGESPTSDIKDQDRKAKGAAGKTAQQGARGGSGTATGTNKGTQGGGGKTGTATGTGSTGSNGGGGTTGTKNGSGTKGSTGGGGTTGTKSGTGTKGTTGGGGSTGTKTGGGKTGPTGGGGTGPTGGSGGTTGGGGGNCGTGCEGGGGNGGGEAPAPKPEQPAPAPAPKPEQPAPAPAPKPEQPAPAPEPQPTPQPKPTPTPEPTPTPPPTGEKPDLDCDPVIDVCN